jgi:hypothetical protein
MYTEDRRWGDQHLTTANIAKDPGLLRYHEVRLPKCTTSDHDVQVSGSSEL